MNLSESDKQKLKDAFSVKASLNGNLVTFVGLDELRDRYPGTWARQRDRIVATSKSILKQFTDPSSDIVLPVGDANFVVLFTRLGKDEAMLRAAAIKAEILRRFVGDEALEDLDVRTQAMELDSGAITQGVLRDLISRSSHSGDPDANSESAPATTDRDNGSAREQAFGASASDIGAAGAVPIEDLEQRFGFSLDDLEFAFQPHLYAKRNVFSIFECRAARYSAVGGEILTGYDVLPREATAEQVTALDQRTLMRVRHGLVDMAVRKRVAVAVAPVSFETMTNRGTASDYLALVQKIPSDLRNYLVLDLCRCPDGVPEGRLSDIVGPLKRLSRAVFVRINPGKQPLAAIKGAGAFGAGFALPSRVAGELWSTAALQRFTSTAHKLGLQAYADGIDTSEKAARCREAGFDYLSGRAIAELSDYIGPVTEPAVA